VSHRSLAAIAFLVLAAAGCGGGAPEHGGSTPLSVAEALRTRPTGVIAVRGNAIVHPDGSARLCEGLAGSYPPQCGGKSVAVAGLDPGALEHPETAGGITWGEATLRGRLSGDVLTLD